MPAKKTTTTRKKPASKRTTSASSGKKTAGTRGGRGGKNPQATAEAIRQKNQIRAVVLFASAILLGCLVLIPGDNLWHWAHNAILGLFGSWSLLWPVLVIYVAVIIAMEKPRGSISGKIWMTVAVIVLFCATGFIFGKRAIPDGLNFFEYIGFLYTSNAGTGGGRDFVLSEKQNAKGCSSRAIVYGISFILPYHYASAGEDIVGMPGLYVCAFGLFGFCRHFRRCFGGRSGALRPGRPSEKKRKRFYYIFACINGAAVFDKHGILFIRMPKHNHGGLHVRMRELLLFYRRKVQKNNDADSGLCDIIRSCGGDNRRSCAYYNCFRKHQTGYRHIHAYITRRRVLRGGGSKRPRRARRQYSCKGA